jgi:hypothetical protein
MHLVITTITGVLVRCACDTFSLQAQFPLWTRRSHVKVLVLSRGCPSCRQVRSLLLALTDFD